MLNIILFRLWLPWVNTNNLTVLELSGKDLMRPTPRRDISSSNNSNSSSRCSSKEAIKDLATFTPRYFPSPLHLPSPLSTLSRNRYQ